MQTVTVDLGERSYPVHIGPGLLARSELLADYIVASQILIVSDTNVAPIYLDSVQKELSAFDTTTCILPAGEATKDLAHAAHIIDKLVEHGFHRDATVIALGGGVIGDMAGFVAACYQRGVAFIQMPTTLLAQVDASVGGKTGVNHERGKNLIGAFHQPTCVLADTNTLGSLPDREFFSGFAEVIKHALIADAEFFDWLEVHMEKLCQRDSEALIHAISRCCTIKAGIVAGDEREHDKRALLNFGHTFAHGIEAATAYTRLLHGEAVAVGMLMAAEMSRMTGHIDKRDCDRVLELLKRANLPVDAAGIEVKAIRQAMSMDKKVRDGKLRLVLLESIGHAFVDENIDPATLDDQLEAVLCEYTGQG